MAALAKQYPNDLNYKALYGETLMMNDQEKKALAVYEEILREDPENIRVLLSLRTYYQGKGMTAVADSLTERVLMNGNASSEDKIHLLRQVISANDPKRVINLALPDSPVITGTSQEVFDYYGLNAAGIVNTVKKALEG